MSFKFKDFYSTSFKKIVARYVMGNWQKIAFILSYCLVMK